MILAPDQNRRGTAYGLGVGPGDPELITLKALRLLRAAPVIAYPAPESGDSFARAIVASHLPGGQDEIEIRMPMVADRFPAAAIYDRAARQIADHLDHGHDVAVLCEGDPFFYGSFLYLFARLADRHRVEVVPGVSSLTACAAALGVPLAARNDSLTVLPAPLPEDVLEARLAAADAVAIIKLGRHFAKIRRVLDRLELTDSSHYVERATLATQRIVPIAEVAAETVPYFSMILVHRRGLAA
ncbi:MAG: precorrin-2 C(20)-methyltransferase [Azospirillum sp.]|nr:precorrin-2 C(20)-methyltransferase [Azospirillum sp.]